MILGMTPVTFVHVVISLVAIGAGFVMVYGLLSGKRCELGSLVFLTTTVLTSVTGFFFPVDRIMPSHIFGVASLIVLAIAIWARYGHHLAGRWRAAYVVCVMFAFYLNCFVLVVQSFLKIPALNALAPTQSEPPFLVTQLVVLALFIVVTIAALRIRGKPGSDMSNDDLRRLPGKMI